MKFWDTSALVPLLFHEPATEAVQQLYESDPTVIVAWTTMVECASAIARAERDGSVTAPQATSAFARPGRTGAGLGASVILTPIWLGTGLKIAGYGRALLLGIAVAVLSSALPYFLELAAIKRVRASTYGVLLSIEPAIAALMGLIVLSQHLVFREIGAIAAIVAAAGGAGWTSGSETRRPTRRRPGGSSPAS